jgi:hypothetical protein
MESIMPILNGLTKIESGHAAHAQVEEILRDVAARAAIPMFDPPASLPVRRTLQS